MGQTFRPCELPHAPRWSLWPRIVLKLRLLANTSHCLRTLSLSLRYPLYFSIHIPFLGWNTPLFLLCSGLSPVSVPINSWQQKKQTEAGDFMLSRYRHWPHGFAEGQTSETLNGRESAAVLNQTRGPRGSQPVHPSSLISGIHKSWYMHISRWTKSVVSKVRACIW